MLNVNLAGVYPDKRTKSGGLRTIAEEKILALPIGNVDFMGLGRVKRIKFGGYDHPQAGDRVILPLRKETQSACDL